MKYILIILLLTLISCGGSLKNLTPKFSKVTDELKFNEENNFISTSITLDNIEYEFMIDTGAQVTFIKDSSIIEDKNYYNSKKSNNFGRKYNTYQYIFKSKNSLFTSENFTYNYLEGRRYECSIESYKGVIGSDFLNYNDYKIIDLNFDNERIKLYNKLPEENLIGYEPVNSSFYRSNYLFSIEIEINGTKELFNFDTGNTTPYSFIIGKDSNINLESTPKIIEFQNKKGEKYYSSVFIYNDNSNDLSNEVILFPDYLMLPTKKNNVGFNYIKKFNWVIDYKSKKVYRKKRNQSFKMIEPILFETNVNSNGDLYFYSKPKGSQLRLQTPIFSINEDIINSNNICHYAKLLRNQSDISKYRIKYK